MKRPLVYIAGAYSADNVTAVFSHMRLGLQLAAEAWTYGFAVYAPWTDVMLHMHAEICLEDCYESSMVFLEKSDAVLVQPVGAEMSFGTQAEIARARELGIPVFRSINALLAWRGSL